MVILFNQINTRNMKRSMSFFLITTFILLSQVAVVAQQTDQPQQFTFSFEKGVAMYYKVSSVIDMDMNIQVLGQDYKTTMKVEMSYNIKLTPEKINPEETWLYMTNENIEIHWDMSQAGADIVMDMKDRKMLGTANGEVFIDTEKGIGEEESKEILGEMQGIFESGTVITYNNGKVKEIQGSESFKKFWNEFMESSVGLLGIVFTHSKTGVGDTWNMPFTLGNMGDIQIEPEVKEEVTFKRQEDMIKDGKTYQVFSAISPFELTNLKGNMGEGINAVTVDILSFDRTANFDIVFDNQRGLLLSNKSVIEGKAKMKSQLQDQDMDMDMIINGSIDIVHLDK